MPSRQEINFNVNVKFLARFCQELKIRSRSWVFRHAGKLDGKAGSGM
jgi:hypothetical protein